MYLVDQMGRVFQSYPHGDALCLNLDMFGIEVSVDVAGRMSRGKDDRSAERHLVSVGSLSRLDANDTVAVDEQSRHACLEVHLAATPEYGVAHVLDDRRQPVGADMRMGVGQDGC